MNAERELVFNVNGTIDPVQLEGMPQEFIDRVTSPEFIRAARARIRAERGIVKTGRREMRRETGHFKFWSSCDGPNRAQRRAMLRLQSKGGA